MPFTFPSHPGLILPLWMAWPRRFDAVALAIGSLLPDLLDAAIEIPAGDLRLNFAHSLLGLVTAVVPGAFGLACLVNPVARWFLRWAPGAPWLRRLVAHPFRWGRVLAAAAVGGFSHLLFDAVSHESFDWLRPWLHPDILPRRLEGTWLSVGFRGLGAPWKIGFFGLAWVVLTLLGALFFVGCCWVARRRESWR